MSPFPVITAQRFLPCELNKLLDFDEYPVKEYTKGLTELMIADKIIREVRYPFYLGQPDDSHTYNAFHGSYKWCRKIKLDYWQRASETLTILVGDCEDSSIAFVAALHALGVPVYEIFGVVRDVKTGDILGGHGWSAFWKEGCYCLYESTLDTPPVIYPEYGKTVDDLKKPLTFRNIVYDPDWVWNCYEFHWMTGMTLRRQLRESIKKWKAIEEAWDQRTKVLKEWEKTSNRAKRILGKLVTPLRSH